MSAKSAASFSAKGRRGFVAESLLKSRLVMIHTGTSTRIVRVGSAPIRYRKRGGIYDVVARSRVTKQVAKQVRPAAIAQRHGAISEPRLLHELTDGIEAVGEGRRASLLPRNDSSIRHRSLRSSFDQGRTSCIGVPKTGETARANKPCEAARRKLHAERTAGRSPQSGHSPNTQAGRPGLRFEFFHASAPVTKPKFRLPAPDVPGATRVSSGGKGWIVVHAPTDL